ncbi:MAG: RrF2 family transcriptional regulator [Planctomycetota bacterium]|jgi:Rrf2 family protein
MKISSQEEYGLRCLMQVARNSADNPVPISEIAVQEGLSVEYVGKLLMKLRKGELVTSVRGKAGGYVLALPADEVSLRLVLDVLSEPIYDPGYCERFAGTEDACVHLDDCAIRPIWSVVNRFLAEALDRVSLADVLEDEQAARARLQQSLADQADQMST